MKWLLSGDRNGKSRNRRDLRTAVVRRDIRRGFSVFPKPVLGTANREYRSCLGVRSFLL
jgi:hypothetical protein